MISTIPVGKNPSAIAIYPFTNKTYVSTSGSDPVSIIHSAGNITNIPVGTITVVIPIASTVVQLLLL